MYTTTSKQQEGCTFKDSHPKCLITTNFDKFHREAVANGDESNLVPRLFALVEAKTLVGAGHVSPGFRVINLKYTVGGVGKERTSHN